EPRTERTGLVGTLDEAVDLRGRDLVVIAETLVALAEEPPELADPSALERLHGLADTSVLRFDVAHARRDSRSQLALPLGVAGVLELTLPGVDDHHRDLVRKWNVPVLERPAVEQQRRACAP